LLDSLLQEIVLSMMISGREEAPEMCNLIKI